MLNSTIMLDAVSEELSDAFMNWEWSASSNFALSNRLYEMLAVSVRSI